MAKYLIWLSFLLGTSNAYASCYASSWVGGLPVYGSLFVDGGTSLAQCQALACQIYPSIQGCPQTTPVCTATFIEKTESCQPNFSGQRKSKQETQTCSNGQTTVYPWQVYSDTCTPNPPSCQASTQSQTLACQVGYVGNITQTQTSICSNPYGQPIWSGSWITTQNTCTKSITNPTNVASPVSPISPANPTGVLATPTPTATVPQTTAPSNQTTMDGFSAPTAVNSAPSSTAPTGAKETNSSKIGIKTLPLALSLELIVKPSITQPSVFAEPSLVQGLPLEVLLQDKTMMELLFQPSFNQEIYQNDLGYEQ